MKRISTDVLIIGSGGAGMRAAIAANQNGADVIIVSKGKCGVSGATVTASADVNCDSRSIVDVLGLPGDRADSKEKFYEDTMSGGKFLNDPKLVEALVNDAPERVGELIGYGAKVKRVYATPGHRHPRGIWVDGRNYAMALLRAVKQLPIQIYDDCAVLDIAVKQGRACGAYALDLCTGEYVVFAAKAVVMATGGAMNLFDVSTACSDLVGDGQAMAYRAGARLVDMEFPMFLLGCAVPPAAEGLNFPFALMNQCGAHLYNRLGLRYMQQYDPGRMEHATRDALIVAAMIEILEGRGSPNGGVWVSLKHLPRGLVEHFFKWYNEWTDMPAGRYECFSIKDLFPDLDGGGIEAKPAAHYWNGGVMIDEDGRTSIPGLFAAGEVTGGVHGANRLSGNAMLEILVWGERSGRRAAESAREAAPSPDDWCEAFDLAESLMREGSGGADIVETRGQMQRRAWEFIGPVRSEDKLREAIAHAESVEGLLADMRCKNRSRSNNREWLEGVSLRSFCETLRITACAALERAESRGSHFRREYPQMVEAWQKNLVVERQNARMSIRCKQGSA